MKKIICYSLMLFLVITLSLFINIKTSDKIVVYASGPKVFEVGDVLPATTQLKISWEMIGNFFTYQEFLKSDSDTFTWFGQIPYTDSWGAKFQTLDVGATYISGNTEIYNYDGGYFVEPYNSTNRNYLTVDISQWSLAKRTITYYDNEDMADLYWEDLNAPSGYTITFEENGGTSVTDLSEQTVLPNPLPTPTKTGYTFDGWYYDSDFTTQAYAGDELEDDVTLYAKWILNTYTITYNSNGGSSIPQTSGATQLPNPLPTPTKSGYTFLGWYYDSSFTQIANAGDTIESNVTLYAKWELNTYTITYNSNGGSSIPQTSGATQLPDPLPTPTKSGYTFLGWYYDSDFTTQAIVGDVITENVTLYAKWQLNTYSITFNSNGGSSVPSISDITQLPSELPIPTRTGYYFQGWFYESDFTNEALAGDPLTSDVTLYAMWTQYNRIFFNTNGGNTIPSIITTDIIPDNLPIPVRNNDIFIGWYYNESLSNPVESNDIISSNITLYASWIDYDGIKEYFNVIYNNGFEEGYNDIYNDSYNQGYDLGLEYGYPYGYYDGYQDGLMEDYPVEFQKFFDKGYFDARDKYGKQIDDYQWESAQIAYENGQKAMGRYSRILMYGIVIITIIGGVLLYYSLKRRNE